MVSAAIEAIIKGATKIANANTNGKRCDSAHPPIKGPQKAPIRPIPNAQPLPVARTASG